MRELKFRVWDKEEKRYLDENELNSCALLMDGKIMLDLAVVHFTTDEGYIIEKHSVEQFTGLHDSDGNEIYEGDILKVVDLTDKYKTFDEWEEKLRELKELPEVVEFKYGSFNVNHSIFIQRIIGNINENPELLQ